MWHLLFRDVAAVILWCCNYWFLDVASFYLCNICFIVRCYKSSLYLLHQYYFICFSGTLHMLFVNIELNFWLEGGLLREEFFYCCRRLTNMFEYCISNVAKSYIIQLRFYFVAQEHNSCCSKYFVFSVLTIDFMVTSWISISPQNFAARRLILCGYADGRVCLSVSCSQPLASLPLRSSPSVAGEA